MTRQWSEPAVSAAVQDGADLSSKKKPRRSSYNAFKAIIYTTLSLFYGKGAKTKAQNAAGMGDTND